MRTEIRRVELPQFVVRESVYPPGLRLPRHAHDYSNVTVVVAGDIEESSDDGEHRGGAFSVVVKPAGIDHENRVGVRGARTVSIQLRDDIPLPSWRWFEQPEIVRAGVALVRAASAPQLEACALELLAEVSAARGGPAASPGWLSEVLRILDTQFDEPLRFDAIAREVGLHPVYLSRAFQRHTGRTMQQYVRALRLRHARHLLATSGTTITRIAADSGFADSSHLCRTFSDLLGVAPKVFRRLCAEVQPVQDSGAIVH